LFELVAKYRAANNLPMLSISKPLSLVANRRMLDLTLNMRFLTHSWSDCPYDIKNDKTWPCVIEAPRRFSTGYEGDGYETLYRTVNGMARPAEALETWKKSSLHNSIILNQGMFKDITWDEIGVAIDGQYAALWFGTRNTPPRKSKIPIAGLGVSFDNTVNGLAKLLPIGTASSTVESGKWQGTSPDKKLKLEIFGLPKEVAEVNVRLSVKLETDSKISANNFAIISTLLGNLLPNWAERDDWLNKSLKLIGTQRSATRTQVVEKVAVEMRAGAGNLIELDIRPVAKISAVEVF